MILLGRRVNGNAAPELGFLAGLVGGIGKAAAGAGAALKGSGLVRGALGAAGQSLGAGGGGAVAPFEPDEDLVRKASGTVPEVAPFVPVDFESVDPFDTSAKIAGQFYRQLPNFQNAASSLTQNKVDQQQRVESQLVPGSAELSSEVTQTIRDTLANGGIPQETAELLSRNFADINRVSGQGGSIATTAATLGMRDVSLQQMQFWASLGAQKASDDRRFAAGFVTDPLQVAQMALPSPGQILQTETIGAATRNEGNVFNNEGTRAYQQAEFNREAAPDPFSQNMLRIQMANYGIQTQLSQAQGPGFGRLFASNVLSGLSRRNAEPGTAA